MSEIINGKEIAEKVLEKLSNEIKEMQTKPCLAVILVGYNPASKLFVKIKGEAAQRIGLDLKKFEFHDDVTQPEIISLIEKLNADASVHGIIVQLPLPEHIDYETAAFSISPEKDVDRFHPLNIGKLMEGHEECAPCTPRGIMKMFEHYNIDLKGKDAVIVNHSNLIGKPLALMMLKKEATVTVCHVATKDLSNYTKNADIVVTATGVPGLIKADMIKDNVIVVDAGIKAVDGKVCGDTDFDAVKEKASYITPVPGGVGPMTVAMLLENTVMAARERQRPQWP
jgi:methylenetetrahydrofolate dehydrogenase (NADP+)/methenyltetrahydrofolate cyclohydrolase